MAIVREGSDQVPQRLKPTQEGVFSDGLKAVASGTAFDQRLLSYYLPYPSTTYVMT
jgi:hypothetical protein